jgi:hypothetical protein
MKECLVEPSSTQQGRRGGVLRSSVAVSRCCCLPFTALLYILRSQTAAVLALGGPRRRTWYGNICRYSLNEGVFSRAKWHPAERKGFALRSVVAHAGAHEAHTGAHGTGTPASTVQSWHSRYIALIRAPGQIPALWCVVASKKRNHYCLHYSLLNRGMRAALCCCLPAVEHTTATRSLLGQPVISRRITQHTQDRICTVWHKHPLHCSTLKQRLLYLAYLHRVCVAAGQRAHAQHTLSCMQAAHAALNVHLPAQGPSLGWLYQPATKYMMA